MTSLEERDDTSAAGVAPAHGSQRVAVIRAVWHHTHLLSVRDTVLDTDGDVDFVIDCDGEDERDGDVYMLHVGLPLADSLVDSLLLSLLLSDGDDEGLEGDGDSGGDAGGNQGSRDTKQHITRLCINRK